MFYAHFCDRCGDCDLVDRLLEVARDLAEKKYGDDDVTYFCQEQRKFKHELEVALLNWFYPVVYDQSWIEWFCRQHFSQPKMHLASAVRDMICIKKGLEQFGQDRLAESFYDFVMTTLKTCVRIDKMK